MRKWGKREASVEDVTRNYCAVVYGLFSNNFKPSAHHCNMQLDDFLHFMKFGFTLHGEWLIRGLRIPRKRRGVVAGDGALPGEPDTAAGRTAVDGTRVSIWFEGQQDFYSGIVHYDTGYVSELANEGKAADNDGDGAPMHYLLKFDDGDEKFAHFVAGHPDRDSQHHQRRLHRRRAPAPAPKRAAQHRHRQAVGPARCQPSRPPRHLRLHLPQNGEIIEYTDGCGYQFQGQTNAGRVARSASSAIGVRRKSVISIPAHGKNHSDHQGHTMDCNLKELTLSDEAPILSGTRDVALALAQHRPEPTQTREAKFSPWAPKDVIYAFYDDALLARAHQEFTPYKDSKFYHARTGMQKDARTAETLGTLNLNRIHCACERCKAPLYDYQNCLVKKVAGAVTQKECKRVRGSAAVTTQTQALADFSLQVRKGSTWPLRVEEDQEGEEGRFWLAKIKDEPERLEGTMTFAGQVFKEGWIVAKAQYYSLLRERGPETARERVYKLLPTDTYLSLNHIIRLESSVNMVVDSKSKSKPKPWVLKDADRARIEAAL